MRRTREYRTVIAGEEFKIGDLVYEGADGKAYKIPETLTADEKEEFLNGCKDQGDCEIALGWNPPEPTKH